MSGRVTDTDRGAKALLRRASELAARRRVRVGILADEPKGEHAGENAGVTLLEVAAAHEFGAPEQHIPQRSFIRATVDEKREEIVKLQTALARQALAGKVTPDAALDLLGAKVAGMCQSRITEGLKPALTQETIDRKGSSTPLVDTGQLRSSITWKVAG